jgi:hypothetical protein
VSDWKVMLEAFGWVVFNAMPPIGRGWKMGIVQPLRRRSFYIDIRDEIEWQFHFDIIQCLSEVSTMMAFSTNRQLKVIRRLCERRQVSSHRH